MHDHHNHCEHALKFCEKCDRPYCTKCKREWYGQSWDWRRYGTYTNPAIGQYPTWTSGFINTAGTQPADKSVQLSVQHTHE